MTYQVLARKWRPRTFADAGRAGARRPGADATRSSSSACITPTSSPARAASARRRSRASSPRRSTARPASPRRRAASARPASRSTPAASSTCSRSTPPPTRSVDEMRELLENARVRADARPLQGLHDRRSAHALELGVQRDAEDARGAAGARQVHPRDDRSAEDAGHGAVALPAVQPEADAGGRDRGASRAGAGGGRRAGGGAGAAADRARGARQHARRADRCSTRRSPTAAGKRHARRACAPCSGRVDTGHLLRRARGDRRAATAAPCSRSPTRMEARSLSFDERAARSSRASCTGSRSRRPCPKRSPEDDARSRRGSLALAGRSTRRTCSSTTRSRCTAATTCRSRRTSTPASRWRCCACSRSRPVRARTRLASRVAVGARRAASVARGRRRVARGATGAGRFDGDWPAFARALRAHRHGAAARRAQRARRVRRRPSSSRSRRVARARGQGLRGQAEGGARGRISGGRSRSTVNVGAATAQRRGDRRERAPARAGAGERADRRAIRSCGSWSRTSTRRSNRSIKPARRQGTEIMMKRDSSPA